MKRLVILFFMLVFMGGCATNPPYNIPMNTQTERLNVPKIPLEAALLITPEAREQISSRAFGVRLRRPRQMRQTILRKRSVSIKGRNPDFRSWK